MVNDDFKRTLALSLVPNMGPMTFRSLLERFGSLKAVFEAPLAELRAASASPVAELSAIGTDEIFLQAEREIKKCADRGIRILTQLDENYPEKLKNIYDPPIVLYVQGQLPGSSQVAVGVVGSRMASGYGLRMAKKISKDLASSGVVVVSGLALGVDTSAHVGAIEGNGTTLAVLGGGISKLYPKQNKKLAEKIVQNGALISEYPCDMSPQPAFFPVRNRLISGFSNGVVIVEARERSGALITADSALEQGRDVFAVPGNVDSKYSKGTHGLIRQGAKLVTGAEDILEEYRLRGSIAQVSPDFITLDENQKKLLEFLEAESVSTDALIERSGLPAQEALSSLAVLEIRGLVRKSPGNLFEKA